MLRSNSIFSFGQRSRNGAPQPLAVILDSAITATPINLPVIHSIVIGEKATMHTGVADSVATTSSDAGSAAEKEDNMVTPSTGTVPSNAIAPKDSTAIKDGLLKALPWVMTAVALIGPHVPVFAPAFALLTAIYQRALLMNKTRKNSAIFQKRIEVLSDTLWKVFNGALKDPPEKSEKLYAKLKELEVLLREISDFIGNYEKPGSLNSAKRFIKAASFQVLAPFLKHYNAVFQELISFPFPLRRALHAWTAI